jgi:hypothetical protein
MNGEFGVQLSYSSNNFFFFSFFFYYGQPLNLISYIWAINIQLLIFKKVIRVIQKLYESYARNITLKKIYIYMPTRPYKLTIWYSMLIFNVIYFGFEDYCD